MSPAEDKARWMSTPQDGPPLRALLDGNILERIIDDDILHEFQAAIRRGRLRIVITPLVRTQLQATKDEGRRALLLAALAALEPEDVPGYGFVLDRSSLGDRFAEEGRLEALSPGKSLLDGDAIIAATAAAGGAVLVTEDGDLGKKASQQGLRSWRFHQLLDYVRRAKT